MDARTFNNYSSRVNEAWASRALGIPPNQQDGIDLLDPQRKIGVEVKFAMDYQGWTVLDWQLRYREELQAAYWGLGVYKLNRPVDKIETKNLTKIESLVYSREFWLVPWEWMSQFPVHNTSGHTDLTSWKLNLVYPKYHKLPKAKKKVMVGNTPVYLCEGVDHNAFHLGKAA